MRFSYTVLMIVFIGCIPPQQMIDPSIPQVLVHYPLPAVPVSTENPPSEISMALFITSDGSVTKVRLTKGSCGPTWDSLAIQTIMRWQFVPARLSDKPISTWFHLRAPIRYMRPESLLLAEIVCDTQEMIDSMYGALKAGQDFSELAQLHSVVPSRENKGEIGVVNIYCYSESLQKELTNLEPDEFTPPLKYGERFIIFKRLKK
jgi:hypothetical protein